MEMPRSTVLVLALGLLSHAVESRSVPARAQPLAVNAKAAIGHAKAIALVSPPITTGSDKKFFGPPFPANYPEDKRPVPEKSILDKLKSADQPYPALQSRSEYDRDFVKDENADKGHWKAQFEYDTLRHKLAKEAADAKGAGDKADKEWKDVSSAEEAVEKASQDVENARKGVDDARAGEQDAQSDKDEDFSGPPSAEKLEKLKKAVQAAEENYKKEQEEFAKCKAELEKAEKNLEELKAKQVEMEQQLAAETKLWMETKTTRLNLKKAKEEAAHSKTIAAQEKLKVAQVAKEEMDKVLAEKKGRHEQSLKVVASKKADLEQAKKDLEKATLVLQKLRGYKPADAVAPTKSGAPMASVMLSFSVMLLSTLF